PQLPSIFDTVSTDKFIELLRPLQKNHMIIAYFAPALTTKDLTCQEQSDCYYNMRQVEPRNYYSQVHRPLHALLRLSHPRERPFLWKSKEAMIQMPCRKNTIRAYNFTNRNLAEHDNFMTGVSWSLTFCPLIQIYTAHDEEDSAFKRRRDRLSAVEDQHSELQLSNTQKAEEGRKPKSDLTILRHPKGIIALKKIALAVEVRRGLKVNYKRTTIDLDGNNGTMQLKELDKKRGFDLAFNTSSGILNVLVVSMLGNWIIASITLVNVTFKPRDLLFYSKENSFCCQSVNVYAQCGSRLTISMYHMDFITNRHFSATDPDYIPKSCWTCQGYLTPGITESTFTLTLLITILGLGMVMLFSIGQNKHFANANDPDLQVKGYA
ncbi:hypothetical protein KR222_006203, partial [Zaprionus bogoriensis]